MRYCHLQRFASRLPHYGVSFSAANSKAVVDTAPLFERNIRTFFEEALGACNGAVVEGHVVLGEHK